MEWVETTGKTVEQAKEAALDQLGIHEDEAEFEVVEEPRPGLFGRMRGEARVRARVAPKAPRPKQERRDRRRKDRGTSKRSKAVSAASNDNAGAVATADDSVVAEASGGTPGRNGGGRPRNNRQRNSKSSNRSRGASPADAAGSPDPSEQGEQDMSSTEIVTVGEQAEIVEAFLGGLLGAFDAEGQVSRQQVDEETIEVGVEGTDLGLLIGPKGQTLAAVQDLSRTVVQRRAPGPHEGRVRVDVSGYRHRRQEALVRFTQQVAAEVKDAGVQKALEPMGPADRKVVHDAANEIEGVSTLSEGEEPRRRVVIVPTES